MADIDAALDQQIFDLSQRQRVADRHHRPEPDDLWRTVEIAEGVLHLVKLWMPHLHITPFLSDNTPATATPQVTSALGVAGLQGRNLELIEHRVLKRLSRSGIKLGWNADSMKCGYALTKDLALTLGLPFCELVPMRSRDNMRAVAEGIEAMGREEDVYWLGMAMHRKCPCRVLTALRCLFTEPNKVTGEA